MKKDLTVEKEVFFNATLDTVIQVLLDTENYCTFVKHIESSKVTHKQNNESEALFKAKISLFTFDYSIVTKKISEHQIIFEQKKGFFRLLKGEWKLKEEKMGVTGIYSVTVKVPILVANKVIKKAISLYFPNMINDFIVEIEKRQKLKDT